MLGLAAVLLASTLGAEKSENAADTEAAVPVPSPPPTCSSIPVELLDALDSGKAKTGDRFRFRALETVVTSDHTTIHSGTIGYGVVDYVTPAGAHGRPGAFELEARYFALHDRDYQVTVDDLATTEIHSGSRKDAPGYVGVMPIPFVGLAVGAFNYFHAGSNVVVPVGYRFAVTPVGDLAGGPRCVPEFQL